MPELPEVETIARDLTQRIVGHTIQQVKILTKSRAIPEEISRKAKNFKVIKVYRRAKLLVMESDKDTLLFHLKMTGQIVFRCKKNIIFGGHPISGLTELPNKYTRAIIYFKNGDLLYFNDLRKFGYLKFISKEEAKHVLSAYGPEPLNPRFTIEIFLKILNFRQKSRLKPFLLDQKNISGLGNIYVDESCFISGIRPTRRVFSLTLKEKKRLYQAIRGVLKKSILYRGTSFNTYVDSDGKTGQFWRYLKVYGRRGGLCMRCNKPILYTKIAGRGTHYCPNCQK